MLAMPDGLVKNVIDNVLLVPMELLALRNAYVLATSDAILKMDKLVDKSENLSDDLRYQFSIFFCYLV